MNPDYCSCNEFEKDVYYYGIRYYRPEDDRFNAVKKAGWYMYSMGVLGFCGKYHECTTR